MLLQVTAAAQTLLLLVMRALVPLDWIATRGEWMCLVQHLFTGPSPLPACIKGTAQIYLVFCGHTPCRQWEAQWRASRDKCTWSATLQKKSVREKGQGLCMAPAYSSAAGRSSWVLLPTRDTHWEEKDSDTLCLHPLWSESVQHRKHQSEWAVSGQAQCIFCNLTALLAGCGLWWFL